MHHSQPNQGNMSSATCNWLINRVVSVAFVKSVWKQYL